MSDDGIRWPGKFDGIGGRPQSPGYARAPIDPETDPTYKHYTIHVPQSSAYDLEEYALKHQMTVEDAIARFVQMGLGNE